MIAADPQDGGRTADRILMRPLAVRALLKTQSDARLVELAKAGHERAFDEIVGRYRGPLERYARQIIPGPLAEDALQQAFVSAWKALIGGAEVRELRPWLYAIARNALLKALARDRLNAAELPDTLHGGPSPAHLLEQRERMRATLQALGDLPENQRVALVGIALDGQSRQALARDMGLTEGAVRQLVHRARTTVRAAATAVTPAPLYARLLGGSPIAETGRAVEIGSAVTTAGAGVVAKLGLVAVATVAVAAAPAAIHLTRAREAQAQDAAAAPLIQDAPGAALPRPGGASVPRDPAPGRADRPGVLMLAGADPTHGYRPPETTITSGTGDDSAITDAAQADNSEPPPDPETDPTAEVDPTPPADPAPEPDPTATVDTTPADSTDPAADAPVDTTPADATDPAAPLDALAADPALGG
jgi:RNA polymerase sigma factor (sigma-70 family)